VEEKCDELPRTSPLKRHWLKNCLTRNQRDICLASQPTAGGENRDRGKLEKS